MTLLIDVTKGWTYIDGIRDDLIKGPVGNMTHFPLCCSTGILKGVGAQSVSSGDEASITNPHTIGVLLKKLREAKYLHEVIRAVQHPESIVYPHKVGRWFTMSQIHAKVNGGVDDGGSAGYTNYRAAQITMFDRVTGHKKDKRFKFPGYNTVWSVDQFITWLESTNGKYGEVLASIPTPGAHGADVRGCIFTPNPEVMKEYHDERIELVREHILAYVAWAKKSNSPDAADKVAATW